MVVAAGAIGARLQAGREKMGLTVLQVAERMHTDPKVIEAIEAENFDALGAPVYARGHIRHYAELVGESGADLITLYSDVSKVKQPDLTRIVKAPPRVESSKLVAPALAVIAIFAVAGAVWWVSALSKKKPQLSETHVVGDESPVAPSEAPAQPAGGSTQTVPSTGSPQAQLPAQANPRVASVSPPVAAPTSPSSGPARVTLRYSSDSWTEVYDSTGARLFYDVGAANSVKTIVGTPPLRVVLGNAAGVAVEFNGHITPITRFALPDGSVQFSISRSGRVIRAKPVTDGG